MSCSSLSQASTSIAISFRRIAHNLHLEFDAEKSSQSSSEYSSQSAAAVCESPPPSEIIFMSGKNAKKKKAAPKASAAAASVIAAPEKTQKSTGGSSKKSSGGSGGSLRKKKAKKTIPPVASQSEDEEEEQNEDPSEDEEEKEESSTASSDTSDEDSEDEDKVQPKPKKKRVVAETSDSSEDENEDDVQAKRNNTRVVSTSKKTRSDAPSFNPHGEDPFNPTYMYLYNFRDEGDERERPLKESSVSNGVAQVTPASITANQKIDWVNADLLKPHKRVEECMDVIRKSAAKNTFSREDCAKFGRLEWDVALMERQNIELKRKNLELEASWELLKTSKKAKKGGQLSKAQAQMVSEANGAINSTVLRMVKWPRPGWTNYSSKHGSICQLMMPKISLPPGLEEKQIEVLWNEVIAPALPRMMTQARNSILQPMRTRFYGETCLAE